jgi:glycosyltransferase involved in cell wall biosynthesis
MSEQKILACTFTCCPPGKPGFTGGEDILGWNMLLQIARYHEVWTFTNAEDRNSVEQGAAELGIDNIHFQFIGLPRWMAPFLQFQGFHQFYYFVWQIKVYFAARRLSKAVQFDLFHHITYANDWMASFIGAFLPIPYVRGPGGGAHRTPKGFESEYPVGGRIWEKVRSFGQWVFRHDPVFVKGQSRARAILVCNNEAALEASKKHSSKIELFPVSGISSEDLAPQKPSSNDGKFRVLTAGSLIRVKGFGLAIRAFQKFAERYPESEFTIVGAGPEEPRLQDLAARGPASSKVKFTGALPREQLMSDMADSDVFLFPSLRDGGGTVVIEAMAAGKPVICLDNGGPGMHINEECGIKITPESPQQAVFDIANALEELYENAERRAELGKSARKRAEELYLWDKLGDRLRDIYNKAFNQKDSASAN